MEPVQAEISRMYQQFTDYILDVDNLYAGVQGLATLVSFSVAAIVTILLIYIGWMYTKTKQDTQITESERRRTKSSSSDCPQTSFSPSDDSSIVCESNPCNTALLPESCPLSKIYKDISKMETLLDPEGENVHNDSDSTEEGPLPFESDPLGYCENLQSKYKRCQQLATEKKIEQDMTDEDKAKEREVRRKQLDDIYRMMEQNREVLGFQDQSQIEDQIKLYM